MPLTLPLYGVIFAESPESEIAMARSMEGLRHLEPERIRIIVEHIERELAEPTQPLDMMFEGPYDGVPGRDAALRRYLRRFVDELRRRGVPGADQAPEPVTSLADGLRSNDQTSTRR